MTTANALVLIALFFGAIGLASMAYVFKKVALGFGSAMAWAVIAGIGFTTSAAPMDLFFMLGFFGIGMMIITAMLSATIRDPINSTEEPDVSAYEKKYQSYGEKQVAMARATMPRSQYHSGGHSRTGMSARRSLARERRRKEVEG